jgi:hypothetical protein
MDIWVCYVCDRQRPIDHYCTQSGWCQRVYQCLSTQAASRPPTPTRASSTTNGTADSIQPPADPTRAPSTLITSPKAPVQTLPSPSARVSTQLLHSPRSRTPTSSSSSPSSLLHRIVADAPAPPLYPLRPGNDSRRGDQKLSAPQRPAWIREGGDDCSRCAADAVPFCPASQSPNSKPPLGQASTARYFRTPTPQSCRRSLRHLQHSGREPLFPARPQAMSMSMSMPSPGQPVPWTMRQVSPAPPPRLSHRTQDATSSVQRSPRPQGMSISIPASRYCAGTSPVALPPYLAPLPSKTNQPAWPKPRPRARAQHFPAPRNR